MKEISNYSFSIQGVRNMKKSLLIVALAFALVFAFAATALAFGPIYNGNDPLSSNGTTITAYNPNYPGYLSWDWAAAADPVNNVESPHGNYTTSSTKCAVCHAVHRAKSGGVALTAWGGITGTTFGGESLAPFESCYFCHGTGATFTDATVDFAVAANGNLSPHTTCGRCHSASPHGGGTSEYPVLAAKLINEHADAQLGVDIASGNNGLLPAMFDLSDPALEDQGMTLATGYLCVGCHGSATNEHVFAVNEAGATPALHYSSNGSNTPGEVTGHRVWATATNDWNQDGSIGALWYSGGGPHDYYQAIYKYSWGGDERWFKVIQSGTNPVTFNEIDPADGTTVIATGIDPATISGWDTQVAFKSALGCGACHDALTSTGKLAFPHGYVYADGTPGPKRSSLPAGMTAADFDANPSSFLWMTVASDAAGTDFGLLVDTAAGQSLDANRDGACLKCHVNAGKTAGVGITY